MTKSFLYLLCLTLMTGCAGWNSENNYDPQEIVDKAIAFHGGEKFEQARISFTFRERDYISIRNGGQYQYERLFQDTAANQYRDVLTNDGFYREINGSQAVIPDTMAAKYSNSVNSVLYFAVLPYGLNDPAVRKDYLGIANVGDGKYFKVKVTFQQEGGGKDFEDVFVYWFRMDTYQMDYMAYRYFTDGGGIRFREAYNVRNIGGLRFADYINYKADPEKYGVEETDMLFNEGKLEELSKIELENVVVE